MKSFVSFAFLFSLVGTASFAAPGGGTGLTLTFKGTSFLHRWEQGEQREFTPQGQEDLEKWTDMITLHRYPDAKDGDGLAGMANAVLENYKAHKAMVIRTDSVPRTADKPAEYLIVVIFPQPTFIEAVFARFKLIGGVGTSTIYSHRLYGKVGNEMSAWLQANGEATEKALMAWDGYVAAKK